MNVKRKMNIVILGLLLSTFSMAQTTKIPTDYLGVPGPISFDKSPYKLVWTSHPTENYYKQEYLSKGEKIEKYKQLILLEVLTGNSKLKDVVAIKIAELKKLKLTNPVVNYEAFEKDGEIILDFLVSENTPNGKYLNIVERNVYRYKSVTDRDGQKYTLLFGVSERAYGDDIDNFLPHLKVYKSYLLNLVGAFEIPQLSIAK